MSPSNAGPQPIPAALQPGPNYVQPAYPAPGVVVFTATPNWKVKAASWCILWCVLFCMWWFFLSMIVLGLNVNAKTECVEVLFPVFAYSAILLPFHLIAGGVSMRYRYLYA